MRKNGNFARYAGESAHSNIVYFRARYAEARREACKRIVVNDISGALYSIKHCNKLVEYMAHAKKAAGNFDRMI